jgi:hypothetical protein
MSGRVTPHGYEQINGVVFSRRTSVILPIYMEAKNNLSETKLVEQLVIPEQLSPAYVAASHCSVDKELIKQELEYLWDDTAGDGKSYEFYLGKISRNPIIKSKITGKYFALPWSVIIKLAVEKGVDR